MWTMMDGDCGRVRWLADLPMCEVCIDYGVVIVSYFVGYN